MDIAELRRKIIQQIEHLDRDQLQEAYGVLLNYLNGNDDMDEWKNLSKEQQQGIHDSIKHMELNDGIPHEEIMKKYRKKYRG